MTIDDGVCALHIWLETRFQTDKSAGEDNKDGVGEVTISRLRLMRCRVIKGHIYIIHFHPVEVYGIYVAFDESMTHKAKSPDG